MKNSDSAAFNSSTEKSGKQPSSAAISGQNLEIDPWGAAVIADHRAGQNRVNRYQNRSNRIEGSMANPQFDGFGSGDPWSRAASNSSNGGFGAVGSSTGDDNPGFAGDLGEGRKSYKFSRIPRKEIKQVPILKEFYSEHPEIAALSEDDVNKIRLDKNGIEVKDLKKAVERVILKPVTQFHHAYHNNPEILETIKEQNFEEPSPIQCQLWPIILSGYDAIGIAQTGTGKTLGFLLPAFVHIDKQSLPRNERGGPSCLILTPTRELAQQINNEVKKYQYKNIRSVCVYGGACRSSQVDVCRAGIDVVIATPGRLNDLVSDGTIALGSITFLVLDEADRMLDMGFEPQIREILHEIRSDRHTVMTSATWPKSVQRLAESYMSDPFLVYIGSLDLAACLNVSQHVGVMRESEKLPQLKHFLTQLSSDDKALIFAARKLKCDELANTIRTEWNWACEVMHGDKDQLERESALAKFRAGRSRILVATDVASRGLDVKDITRVLNYDFPSQMEEYVHRIGRSGRAGKKGMSVTFITYRDKDKATPLIEILRKANQEIPDGLIRMSREFETERKQQEAMMQQQSNGASGISGKMSSMSLSSNFRRNGGGGSRKKEFIDPFTGESIGTFR